MRFSLTLALLLAFTADAYSQSTIPDTVRSSEQALARGILDGNLIETNFRNHGEWSQLRDVPYGQWHGGPHLDGIGFYVAAQVPGERIKWGLAETDTVLHPISMNYFDGRTVSPQGDIWGWLPLEGFHNPDRFDPSSNQRQPVPAQSNDPSSWPAFWPDRLSDTTDPGWPGAWNGFFGKDSTHGAVESFYVMNDHGDYSYTVDPTKQRPFTNLGVFYPDPSDSTMGGLGLQVEVRSLQWDHLIAEDMLFLHFRITNVGAYEHDQLYTGFIIDSGLGWEEGDEGATIDAERSAVYMWDRDGFGTRESGATYPLGYVGMTVLDIPDDLGLTGVDLQPRLFYTENLMLTDDEWLWNRIARMAHGNLKGTRLGFEPFFLLTSGPASLAPNTSTTFVAALVFGADKTDFLRNVEVAHQLHEDGYTLRWPIDTVPLDAELEDDAVVLEWDPRYGSILEWQDGTLADTFEGFRLYRASQTDDGFPEPPFAVLKQWDLDNDVSGEYTLSTGESFDLGSNTGLDTLAVHDQFGYVSAYRYRDTDIEPGATYAYILTAYTAPGQDEAADPMETAYSFSVDGSGHATSTSGNVAIVTVVGTAREEADALPKAVLLDAAYPNPFAETTTIPFTLSETADVRLIVIDVLGRTVATLAEGRHAAGPHQVIWQSDQVPSGLYLIRLEAGDHHATRSILRVR